MIVECISKETVEVEINNPINRPLVWIRSLIAGVWTSLSEVSTSDKKLGRPVKYFDENGDYVVATRQYPRQVTVIHLTIDGKKYSVASDSIPTTEVCVEDRCYLAKPGTRLRSPHPGVLLGCHKHGRWRGCDDGEQQYAFPSRIVVGEVTISFRAANLLRVGDELPRSEPRVFHFSPATPEKIWKWKPRKVYSRRNGWDDKGKWTSSKRLVVTNGDICVPLKRPHGAEWRHEHNLPISSLKGISKGNWSGMIKALMGLECDGTIPTLSVIRSKKKKLDQDRKMAGRIRKLLKGQCFRSSNTTAVAIGTNLLFTLKDGERTIFAVDSPEYGRALYLFESRSVAFDWASRRITVTEARKAAFARFVHAGKWEERVAKIAA